MKTYIAMAAIALSATAFAIKAEAMPLGSALGQAADGVSTIEKTQFFYGGRNYCWYPDGWHGPGFYWCGFAFRPGLGWGGPVGWRGWHHGGPRVGGPRVVGPRMGGPHMRGPHMGGPRMVGPRVGGGGGRGGPHGGQGFRKH